ncbi:MAG: hypothetical protein AAF840_00415 [Bacteroidota bacterium]
MHHHQALPTGLTTALEYTEASAWAQFYRPKVAPRSKLALIASATAGAVPEVDLLPLNRVIGLGLAPSTTPQDINRAIAFYHRAGAPRFLVQHSPLGQLNLPSWLRNSGFRLHSSRTKMLCSQPTKYQALATGLRVARIDRSKAIVFGNILCAGFGWPPLGLNQWLAGPIGQRNYHHYLVFLGKLPIAAGAMYVANGYAHFLLSATRPDFQGQGAHALLIQARLANAQALGCKYFMAETPATSATQPQITSRYNLEQFGFREVYQQHNYLYTF